MVHATRAQVFFTSFDTFVLVIFINKLYSAFKFYYTESFRNTLELFKTVASISSQHNVYP